MTTETSPFTQMNSTLNPNSYTLIQLVYETTGQQQASSSAFLPTMVSRINIGLIKDDVLDSEYHLV